MSKLWCHDDRALSWLAMVVPRLNSPREGTGLLVINQADLPVRATLYVPNFDEDIGKLHNILSAQNPWYNVSSWSLYIYERTANNRPGVFLVLRIPRQQLEIILLREKSMSYSTGAIKLRLKDFQGSCLTASVDDNLCADMSEQSE
ncbi:jg7124 [Pararge aegeria aegeria]|uniref:Jg7124 protein n=1 Tax=Pararge aegeria aegeria TaxID=348720 RepID=A0A8S4QNU2_9NEOP|nr:jg7124 [Pararge aegeria aegeria]